MVNVRFRGVELEESAKSEEARRRNPAVEAERELLDTVGEAYIPDVANIENWQRVAGFSIGITRQRSFFSMREEEGPPSQTQINICVLHTRGKEMCRLTYRGFPHTSISCCKKAMYDRCASYVEYLKKQINSITSTLNAQQSNSPSDFNVNSTAVYYHLTPFSVCRIMLEIRRKQGLGTFWKGQGSKLGVRGMNLAAELLISAATSEQLPREVNKSSSSLTQLAGHIIGKSISIILTLPFWTASLAETVQTEQIEKRSPFTFIKEGMFRLIGWQNTSKGHGRLFPLWTLVPSTLLHGLSHYVITGWLQQLILVKYKVARRRESENSEQRSMMEAYFPELMASLTGTVLTEILLYPLETVLYRLHLQGTRTMIDDTDNGYAVVSLCSNYDGFLDCFSRIKGDEGVTGFYKGFGALLLQYLVQLLVLRFTKAIYMAISKDFRHSDNVDK